LLDLTVEFNIYYVSGINQNAIYLETIVCLAAFINLIILSYVNCSAELDASKGYNKLPTHEK